MKQGTDIALTAHTFRQKDAEPGTRGPHQNLFSGGSTVKKAEAPARSVSERVASFAQANRLKDDTRRVLEAVVEHHERTGQPLQLDGFDLARKAGVPYDRVHVAKGTLLSNGCIRTRWDGAFAVEGLVPGDSWDAQYRLRR